MTVEEGIRRAMQETETTVSDMASMTNVSKQAVYKALSGKNSIKSTTAERMADAIGYEVAIVRKPNGESSRINPRAGIPDNGRARGLDGDYPG